MALVGSLAFGLFLRLASLDMPLDRDEGAYAYIGSRLWVGDAPYRDTFDHKPPGIYYVYAVATRMASGILPVRLMGIALFVASTILLAAVARNAFGPHAGVLAGALWACLGNAPEFEAARLNTEQASVPFLLAAVFGWQMSSHGHQRWWLTAAGACSAASLLVKQTSMLPVLVLVGAILGCALRARDPRRLCESAAFLGLGGAAVLGAALVHLALSGALTDAYQSIVTVNRYYVDYYREVVGGDPFDLRRIRGPWLAAAAVGLTVGVIRQPSRWWTIFFAAWCGAALVSAKLGLRDFSHYFVPVLPGFVLLTASGAPFAVTLLRRRRVPAAVALTGVTLIFLGWQVPRLWDFYVASSPEAQTELEFGLQGPGVFAASDEIAAYVEAHTREDERILVWAAEAQVYYLARRAAASKYIYVNRFDVVPDGLAQFRADFLAAQPRVVVTYDPSFVPFKPFWGEAIETLVAHGYRLSYTAGLLRVYEPG